MKNEMNHVQLTVQASRGSSSAISKPILQVNTCSKALDEIQFSYFIFFNSLLSPPNFRSTRRSVRKLELGTRSSRRSARMRKPRRLARWLVSSGKETVPSARSEPCETFPSAFCGANLLEKNRSAAPQRTLSLSPGSGERSAGLSVY